MGVPYPPPVVRGQGVDGEQAESAARAILALLGDPVAGPQTDMIFTYREGAYEAWAARGLVRWVREIEADGAVVYREIEVIGANPLANQDPTALATVAAECAAAGTDEPARAYVEPEAVSYPFGYERVSQLFDHPDAPDLWLNPRSYAAGVQPGQHGALDVIQSRSVLLFSGAGVGAMAVTDTVLAEPALTPGSESALTPGPSPQSGRGGHSVTGLGGSNLGTADESSSGDMATKGTVRPALGGGTGVRAALPVIARQIDILPTICRAFGFPLIDGADATGRTASERGVGPDVYLRRQDGRVIEEVLDADGVRPERAFILLLDGLSTTELIARLEADADDLPHLRRLVERGTLLRHGSTTNYPSITWPSHYAIGTGTWSGHHGVLNPIYYARGERRLVDPQGDVFGADRYLAPEVETIFEAFARVYGPGTYGASINEPCCRGADHATLERRLVGDRERLRALTEAARATVDGHWEAAGKATAARDALVDSRGEAQLVQQLTDDAHPTPRVLYYEISITDGAGHDHGPHHAGARRALDEADRRVGTVLRLLDERGLFEGTLFVVTSDHGMANQDVARSGDPASRLGALGFACRTPERLIYLTDLAVTVARQGDGVRVRVEENDRLAGGSRPAVVNATVALIGADGETVTELWTDEAGQAVLPLPAGEAARIEVRADGFNARQLRLDGSSIVPELRAALYGDAYNEGRTGRAGDDGEGA